MKDCSAARVERPGTSESEGDRNGNYDDGELDPLHDSKLHPGSGTARRRAYAPDVPLDCVNTQTSAAPTIKTATTPTSGVATAKS